MSSWAMLPEKFYKEREKRNRSGGTSRRRNRWGLCKIKEVEELVKTEEAEKTEQKPITWISHLGVVRAGSRTDRQMIYRAVERHPEKARTHG